MRFKAETLSLHVNDRERGRPRPQTATDAGGDACAPQGQRWLRAGTPALPKTAMIAGGDTQENLGLTWKPTDKMEYGLLHVAYRLNMQPKKKQDVTVPL